MQGVCCCVVPCLRCVVLVCARCAVSSGVLLLCCVRVTVPWAAFGSDTAHVTQRLAAAAIGAAHCGRSALPLHTAPPPLGTGLQPWLAQRGSPADLLCLGLVAEQSRAEQSTRRGGTTSALLQAIRERTQHWDGEMHTNRSLCSGATRGSDTEPCRIDSADPLKPQSAPRTRFSCTRSRTQHPSPVHLLALTLTHTPISSMGALCCCCPKTHVQLDEDAKSVERSDKLQQRATTTPTGL